MLTHNEIKQSVLRITSAFPVSRVSYFGSYAGGIATDDSDLDLLVEFNTDEVTLFTVLDLKYRLEDALGIAVDVIHAPVPEDSLLEIYNEVLLYAA